jgi:hypothetical protein
LQEWIATVGAAAYIAPGKPKNGDLLAAHCAFGAFSVKQRPAHTGRDPRTGAHVAVEQKSAPFFKTGKEMRERLNRTAAS